jgi:hypothetical protein
MPASERRFWPRPVVHEHVLGEVVFVYLGQTRIRALMLYEHSVERDHAPLALPELRGRLIGDMDDIICTICGRPVANWHLGEDALEALLSAVL